MSFQTDFAHRQNADRTWDSICRRCYLTVGRAQCEDDLAIEENLHACTGLWAIEHASDFEMVGISQNRTHGVGIEAESVLLPRRLDG